MLPLPDPRLTERGAMIVRLAVRLQAQHRAATGKHLPYHDAIETARRTLAVRPR